jgi:hypothetical protein
MTNYGTSETALSDRVPGGVALLRRDDDGAAACTQGR